MPTKSQKIINKITKLMCFYVNFVLFMAIMWIKMFVIANGVAKYIN